MTPSHPEDLQAEHCQSYSPFLGGGEGVTDHSQAICWEIFFFLVFINLAALGLSCGMWNLFYQPQIELGPLHWKHGVSATGPPGKSLLKCLNHGKLAQTVKCLPAMKETLVRFLGREDPLEKEMAIHSSTLAWKIPWTEEPDRL